MFITDMLLIFVLPGVAALVAAGGVPLKLAFYLGTAALAFAAEIIIESAFIQYPTLASTQRLRDVRNVEKWWQHDVSQHRPGGRIRRRGRNRGRSQTVTVSTNVQTGVYWHTTKG